MARQLTLDELIEAADRAGLPTVKPIMRAIESLAMALGADLARICCRLSLAPAQRSRQQVGQLVAVFLPNEIKHFV